MDRKIGDELVPESWGWDVDWQTLVADRVGEERIPGRVVLEKRGLYRLASSRGEVSAGSTGRLRHRSEGAPELPAVGDWVLYRPRRPGERRALIQEVLPRRSRLSRKLSGQRAEEQVVAANLDTVLVVMALDGDFNLRRLERFLVVAWESGAEPVIVLNKSDLAVSPEERRAEAEAVASGAPVLLTSCRQPEGLEELLPYLRRGRTVVLLGSSGVGKTSLVNRLLGEELLKTGAVREGDDRGRHTTTHRQLVLLPGGALLLDNPGVREIQPWSAGRGLDAAFEDVCLVARECRFRDCSHDAEPGCAVRDAVASGALSRERVASYRQLAREDRALALRRDELEKRREKRPVVGAQRAFRKTRPRG